MSKSGEVALAWLAHPVTLAGTAVLIVNDHLLKAVYPGLVTGKLSDVAGLAMAPALLATVVALAVPRVPVRWLAIGSVLAVGAGFTLVKAIPADGTTESVLWSGVRADPTDLLTLPALVLSVFASGQASRAPVASRTVRLVRVLVVWPVAALGVAATSAPSTTSVSPTFASEVQVVGNEIVLYSGDVMLAATTDGVNWRRLNPIVRSVPVQNLRNAGHTTQTCLPDDPGHCFRVVPGKIAVEESVGGSWQTAWSVSDGRREFLLRSFGRPVNTDDVRSFAVAAMRTYRGVVVVVANGRDGFAARDAAGTWRRVGFPHGTKNAAPHPLVAPGQQIWLEYWLAHAIGAVLMLLGASIAARPSMIGPPLIVMPIVVVLALFYDVRTDGPLDFLIGPIAIIAVMLSLATAITYAVADGVMAGRGRLSAAIVATGFLGAVGAAVPMFGWSAGTPDSYDTALAWSAGAVAVATAAVTALGVLRPTAGRRSPQGSTATASPAGDTSR